MSYSYFKMYMDLYGLLFRPYAQQVSKGRMILYPGTKGIWN